MSRGITTIESISGVSQAGRSWLSEGHPFLRFLVETVTGNLISMANEQNRTLASMRLSYEEVIDTTGPGALTQAFLTYASKATVSVFTSANATMLEAPMMVDDILLLPIRAFSIVEANKAGVDGAHSTAWPAVLFHWGAGTWKKDHSQKPEQKMATSSNRQSR